MQKLTLIAFLAIMTIFMTSCNDLPFEDFNNGGNGNGWEKDDDKERDDKHNDKNQKYDIGLEFCFEYQYPIVYDMPDGSEIALNSAEEFDSKIMQWHMDNPNVEGIGQMRFPISIIYSDGSVVDVNSQRELDKIIDECFKNWRWDDDEDWDWDEDEDEDDDEDDDSDEDEDDDNDTDEDPTR